MLNPMKIYIKNNHSSVKLYFTSVFSLFESSVFLSLAMPTQRKKLLLGRFSVSLGCGSCRKVKLSGVFNPKPKPKPPRYQRHTLNYYFYDEASAASATATTTPSTSATTATFSPAVDYYYDDQEYDVANTSRAVKVLYLKSQTFFLSVMCVC